MSDPRRTERTPAHVGGELRLIRLVELFGPPALEAPEPPLPSPEERFAEGLAEGLALGRAEARAQADARAEAVAAESRAALTQAIDTAAAAHGVLGEALIGAVAQRLAGLGLTLARAVLAAEPAVRPETLAALVAEGLDAAGRETGGVLLVHPQGLEAAGAVLPPGWTATADPSLPPGAVELAAEPARFGASLDAALADLGRRLGAP